MDDIEKYLLQCSLRVPQKMGTGCWVSPSIGVTCAHAVPDGLEKGDEFEIIDDLKESLKAVILTIRRHDKEDVCIFTVPGISRRLYLVLKDDVNLGDEVYGKGYPVFNGVQYGLGFNGRYESHFDHENPDFPVGLHKIKDAQILKGFSGSGVINLRTGSCIGIMSESMDPRSSTGGLVTKSELILQYLNSVPTFSGLDTTKMAAFWSGRCGSAREKGKATQAHLNAKRKDEAYTCDRKFFSHQFESYWQNLRATSVQHYIIIGEARHSPLGLARKLTYESFTCSDKKGDVKYHGDPELGLPIPTLTIPSNFLQFLKTLYNNHFKEDSVYNDKIWEMDESAIIRYLVEQYRMSAVTILQIKVIISDLEKDLKNLLEIMDAFVRAVNLEVSEQKRNTSFKVLFFWCFEHRSRFKDKTTAITRSCLQRFSAQPVPELSFIERLFPERGKKKLQQFLGQTTAGELGLIPVNHCERLTLPPQEDIQRWMGEIESGSYRIPETSKRIAISVENTIELEKEFRTIIDDFNKLRTGS